MKNLELKHSRKRCATCEKVVRTTQRWLQARQLTIDEARHRIMHYHHGCPQAAFYAQQFVIDEARHRRDSQNQHQRTHDQT